MKKVLVVCLGLIIFVSLNCVGSDIVHKVGVFIKLPLSIQSMQNLSFGSILPAYNGSSGFVNVNSEGVSVTNNVAIVQGGHPGTIKILGSGYVSIESTPPTKLFNVEDSTKTLDVSDMGIVYSDGSAINNMNEVEITNNELELKTVGKLHISGSNQSAHYPGEYKVDWPITVMYSDYEPE